MSAAADVARSGGLAVEDVGATGAAREKPRRQKTLLKDLRTSKTSSIVLLARFEIPKSRASRLRPRQI
jgi:hypothetical protein